MQTFFLPLKWLENAAAICSSVVVSHANNSTRHLLLFRSAKKCASAAHLLQLPPPPAPPYTQLWKPLKNPFSSSSFLRGGGIRRHLFLEGNEIDPSPAGAPSSSSCFTLFVAGKRASRSWAVLRGKEATLKNADAAGEEEGNNRGKRRKVGVKFPSVEESESTTTECACGARQRRTERQPHSSTFFAVNFLSPQLETLLTLNFF